MTNAQIILNESIRLMNDGILKGSGQFVQMETVDGIQEIELPEAIHTFNGWKQLGFTVKKGEKSSIKFPIWKHTSKMVVNQETGEENERSSMFMKTAAFFTFAQVEELGKGVA